MADDMRATAFDPAAPQAERTDALTQMMRGHMPGNNDILPLEVIQRLQADMDLIKANQVIPFPTERTRPSATGRQSVGVDEFQTVMQGDYYDPPVSLSPDVARRMVDQTPILSAIIMTRQRQVSRFCAPAEDDGIGFGIRHIDPRHELSDEEEESVKRLTRFFQHCGWEWNPRKRKALKRDNFSTFMMKQVRDSLSLDRAPIEIEMKRDQSLGIDGFYAIDGGTIRLCPEGGFRGDEDVFAVQVINGRITSAYQHGALIMEPRNPRADVRYGDYGFSELETLVQTITSFLNAMTLNASGFAKNSIPKGVLQLYGEYGDDDLVAFKRYWQQMTRGAENAWNLPILVNKDPQGKAAFEKFGVDFNEMYFSKWMTFLTSLACASYSMDPNEINFESFTNGSSSLSGSDTEEKITASKDKGLRPLLSYFENTFSDFIVSEFGDKYCFRWAGLDPKDEARDWEARKLVLTVDELRARLNEPPHEDKTLGNAPLNPSLTGLYQQSIQPQGQDFGGGGDFGAPGGDEGGEGGDGEDQEGDQEGPQGGQPGGQPPGPQQQPGAAGPPGPPQPPAAPEGPPEGEDFGKALPTFWRIGG